MLNLNIIYKRKPDYRIIYNELTRFILSTIIKYQQITSFLVNVPYFNVFVKTTLRYCKLVIHVVTDMFL